MKSKNPQPIKRSSPVAPNKLEWAKFIAECWVKFWVLALVTIALIGGMVVVWVVVWYDKDPKGVIVTAIAGGVITVLGKLYHVVIKMGDDDDKE